MEKEIKYILLVGVFTLFGVFTGWAISSRLHGPFPVKPPSDDGGTVTGLAHQTQTVGNTSCSSGPPLHVATTPTQYQTVPVTNPMFCWDTFGNNITDWSFTLKTYPQYIAVSGCTTNGFVPTTTVSITCSNLTSGQQYIGYLSYHYGGQLYPDNHLYTGS